MTSKEEFESAVATVKGLSSRPSNEDLLSLYGLFKQATEGDVTGKKPGRLAIKDRAKYEAWEERKGLSDEEARAKYVQLVQKLSAAD